MSVKEFARVVAALRAAVAGNDLAPQFGLAEDAEVILEREMLPELGRAALEIVLSHNLAKLKARKTLLMAVIPKPPLH